MIFFSHSSRIRILQLTFALVCSCSEGLLTTEKHHLAPFCLLIFCFICLSIQIKHFFFLFFFYLFIYFICYSKVQQLQLLSQSIHAQTDYTPKHTCNSTITTQGMPTVILQVLFQKEETRKKLIIFVKEGKLTRLQSPFVH